MATHDIKNEMNKIQPGKNRGCDTITAFRDAREIITELNMDTLKILVGDYNEKKAVFSASEQRI